MYSYICIAIPLIYTYPRRRRGEHNLEGKTFTINDGVTQPQRTYFMCLFAGVFAVEMGEPVQPPDGGKQNQPFPLLSTDVTLRK